MDIKTAIKLRFPELSNEEFQIVLNYCQMNNLPPNLIYIIRSGNTLTINPTIEGLRYTLMQHNINYNGNCTFYFDNNQNWDKLELPRTITAKIEINDKKYIKSILTIDYYKDNEIWKEHPLTMLCKTAEAIIIRQILGKNITSKLYKKVTLAETDENTSIEEIQLTDAEQQEKNEIENEFKINLTNEEYKRIKQTSINFNVPVNELQIIKINNNLLIGLPIRPLLNKAAKILDNKLKYEWYDSDSNTWRAFPVPENIIAKAIKVSTIKDDYPVTAVAFLVEHQRNNDEWRENPNKNLAKCAVSILLRRLYPNIFSGIYSISELPATSDEKILSYKVKYLINLLQTKFNTLEEGLRKINEQFPELQNTNYEEWEDSQIKQIIDWINEQDTQDEQDTQENINTNLFEKSVNDFINSINSSIVDKYKKDIRDIFYKLKTEFNASSIDEILLRFANDTKLSIVPQLWDIKHIDVFIRWGNNFFIPINENQKKAVFDLIKRKYNVDYITDQHRIKILNSCNLDITDINNWTQHDYYEFWKFMKNK